MVGSSALGELVLDQALHRRYRMAPIARTALGASGSHLQHRERPSSRVLTGLGSPDWANEFMLSLSRWWGFRMAELGEQSRAIDILAETRGVVVRR